MILTSGLVKGDMINNADQRITIEKISSPELPAPFVLYSSENTMLIDVIATQDCEIAFIHERSFQFILQSDSQVLSNFVQYVSDRARFLSDKIR